MNEAISDCNGCEHWYHGTQVTDPICTRSCDVSVVSLRPPIVRNCAAQYDAILTQITDMASDSGYKGINLLSGTGTLDVKFNENGSNSLTISGFDASATGLAISTSATVGTGTGWADVTDGTANITASLTNLTDSLTTLRTQSQNLASNLNVVSIRADFTTQMINTLTTGADKLTAPT